MDKCALSILFSLLFLIANAQNRCSGVILDSISGQPVEFANVGIAEKGIGTVSNEKGEFAFNYPDSLKGTVLRVSIIGYKSKRFKLDAASSTMNVRLSPESIALSEVPVSAKKSKIKILGNQTTSKGVSAGFNKNSLGAEFAIRLNIKNKQTHLRKLKFQINNNSIDSLVFRFNVYSVNTKGSPNENILKQNILVRPKTKTGMVEFDLEPYSIFVDDDVFIALEWIKDLGDASKLYFATKMIGSATYFRQASQDKWEKVSPIGVGLHAEVSY